MIDDLPGMRARLYSRGSSKETMTMEVVQQHTTGEGRLVDRTRPDMAKRNSSAPIVIEDLNYNNKIDRCGVTEIAAPPVESRLAITILTTMAHGASSAGRVPVDPGRRATSIYPYPGWSGNK